jgi:putative sigma-54 modulation protein
MQISTTARHCELAPELRELAESKLQHASRFARDIHEVHLTVTAERFRHVAEITLRLDHHEVVCREEATEMRASIEGAIERLEEQLRRFKDRRTAHQRGQHEIPPQRGDVWAEDEETED